MLHGTWLTPFPAAFSARTLAADSEWVLVGGRGPAGMEVRAGSVRSGSLTFERTIAVPVPSGSAKEFEPWPALDRRRTSNTSTSAVAIARRDKEFDGGEGVVVFPDLLDDKHLEVASPTDDDISFGEPLLLFGDDLFVAPPGAEGAAWHYRRTPAGFRGGQLPSVTKRENVELLALSSDGLTLIDVGVDVHSRSVAERYTRASLQAAFIHERTIQLRDRPTAIAFFGMELLVAFDKPDTDATAISVIGPDGRVVRGISVPVERGHSTVQGMVADGRWAALIGNDQVLALEFASGAVHSLCLPEGERPDRSRYPRAAVFGDRIVVSIGNGLGVYDL